MASWTVRSAKAHFSEFLDAAIKDGPQFVTRRGIEIAALVSIEEWRRLQRTARPSLNALLLSPEARSNDLVNKSPFSKYQGIGNPKIKTGRGGIRRWLGQNRGR
jgi:prevent-host-death family protein